LTIDPGPTVTLVKPSSIALGKSKTVTITGTGFVTGAKVKVAGTEVTVTAVHVVNSTEITFTITVASTAAAGKRTLTVMNPDHGKATGSVTIG
jgi:hypothetical protein